MQKIQVLFEFGLKKIKNTYVNYGTVKPTFILVMITVRQF